MRYLSIDVETTGLKPSEDQIIQIAMVLDNTMKPEVPLAELPYLVTNIMPYGGRIQGDPYALSMNVGILEALALKNNTNVCKEEDFEAVFNAWALKYELEKTINTAGKNFGTFDLQFIKYTWPNVANRFRHRILDVGSLFIRKEDTVMPDLATCKKRAGIETPVAHTALQDALDVVACIRASFERKSQ